MLVGSANVDLVVRASHFPSPGETIQGSDFQTFSGGKGANQAVSAAKLGGKCSLVAKVGCDGFGDLVLDSLASNGVDIDLVMRDTDHPTGIALITVSEAGENTIVVAPGTNSLISPWEVERSLENQSITVLLMQLEIPLDAVIAASSFADPGILILNPAPARDLPDELLALVDFLTPNEIEAHQLTGIMPVDDGSCIRSAAKLLDKGVKNVLFTLGERGSFLANESGGRHFPSIEVKPVDTTAAGDSFNGAFARFISSGESVERSITLANVAGALSTTKHGAQDSMPTLDDVLARESG